MKTPSISSELSGGAGFTFEAHVAAFYLTTLVCEHTAPALGNRIVCPVALQQKAGGEPLDDVVVDAEANDMCRLRLQVKRSLIASSAVTNTDFAEVVVNSLRTIMKEDFREGVDRVGAATELMSENGLREVMRVCDISRTVSTSTAFFALVAGDALSVNSTKTLSIFRDIVQRIDGICSDESLYKILRHFVIVKLSLLDGAATDVPQAINQLRVVLPSSNSGQAPNLWSRLLAIAHEGAARFAVIDRRALLLALVPDFRFSAAPSLKKSLGQLAELCNYALADISAEIAGVHIERSDIADAVSTDLTDKKVVLLHGLPGCGKSAVLKSLVVQAQRIGPAIFIKNDRLSGRTWIEFATSIGMDVTDPHLILSEIAAIGTPTLFVDGLDRIELEQRPILIDLLNAIIGDDSGAWRLVATLRDSGLEPVRNWLPRQLIDGSALSLRSVAELSDAEADELATKVPRLRHLLYATGGVRILARRPFFANLLARADMGGADANAEQLVSEVDLMRAWWNRGGYSAQATDRMKRQNALLEIARDGAQRVGKYIKQSQLSPATLDVAHELIADDVVRSNDQNQLSFSHDIFFEWSYCVHLSDCEDNWTLSLQSAGEPPTLGRSVELLSQLKLATDAETWRTQLGALATSGLRSQWTRAWLLGIFGGSPLQGSALLVVEDVLLSAETSFLKRLLVWLQAEKTIPNRSVISGQVAGKSSEAVMQIAEAFSWPSDFDVWRRALDWLLDRSDRIPCQTIQALASVFEVWQNALSQVPNRISERIVEQSIRWLIDLDRLQHLRVPARLEDKWSALGHDEQRELERALRRVTFVAASAYSQKIDAYLATLTASQDLRREGYRDLQGFSTILAKYLPERLATLTLSVLLEPLPVEQLAKQLADEDAQIREMERARLVPPEARTRFDELALTHISFGPNLGHDIWRDLCIRDGHYGEYFPASPLREPFASLFTNAPCVALELVKSLSRHAITAWKQLYSLGFDRQGTPIPIRLMFPWGVEDYWGDEKDYCWFRGIQAASALSSALMALEKWAFQEIEHGRPRDEVLKDILSRHPTISALGIAVAICLEHEQVTPLSLALVTTQRLWSLDIRRSVSDASSEANLIGFGGYRGDRATEEMHLNAIRDGNARNCRKRTLRDIYFFHLASSDPSIREAAQKAVQKFTSDLPFAMEEEKSDSDLVASLRQTAEVWAECGRPENYNVTPVNPESGQFMIQMDNPRLAEPALQASIAANTESMQIMGLAGWTARSLESGRLENGFSLSEALRVARSHDHSELFDAAPDGAWTSPAVGAVVGVAGLYLRHESNPTSETLEWVHGVLDRAHSSLSTGRGPWLDSTLVLWHTGVALSCAYACLVASGKGTNDTRAKLISLVAHPVEGVAIAAVKSIFSCWDFSHRICWVTVDLVGRLAAINVGRKRLEADDANEAELSKQVSNVVFSAVRKLESQDDIDELYVPDSVQDDVSSEPSRIPSVSSLYLYEDESPAEDWRHDFVAKVLSMMPLATMLSRPDATTRLAVFSDRLVAWTLFRVIANKDSKHRRSRDVPTGLIQWIGSLGYFVAEIALSLGSEESTTRFINPMFGPGGRVSAALLAPFIHRIVCAIHDDNEFPVDAVRMLDACIHELSDKKMLDAPWRSEGRLNDRELVDIVKDALLVSIEHAPLAARFANGDWSQINALLPTIGRIINAGGWSVDVGSAFILLCERASSYYPTPFFATQAVSILAANKGIGWTGTTLPRRLAALVQIFIEKGAESTPVKQDLLRVLDYLVDLGDRRSAALQLSPAFRDVRS